MEHIELQETEFRMVVQGLIGHYDGTPLQSRWQEAISFGAGLEASDYWIRDSDNVVNIVWLNSDGIRDVAMVTSSIFIRPHREEADNGAEAEEPEADEGKDDDVGELDEDGEVTVVEYRETMFNFVPMRNIASFEVREGDDIARQYGLEVSGNKFVHVILNTTVGHLYWVANLPSEAEQLDHFLTSVLSAFLYTR